MRTGLVGCGSLLAARRRRKTGARKRRRGGLRVPPVGAALGRFVGRQLPRTGARAHRAADPRAASSGSSSGRGLRRRSHGDRRRAPRRRPPTRAVRSSSTCRASYAQGTAVPLVLMLHGCTQTPADFETGTQMDAQADAAGFIVAYPEEPSSANVRGVLELVPARRPGARVAASRSCWRTSSRDLGKDYSVDAKQVFAAGLSAGRGHGRDPRRDVPRRVRGHRRALGPRVRGRHRRDVGASRPRRAADPAPRRRAISPSRRWGHRPGPVPVIVFHGDADQVVDSANGHADRLAVDRDRHARPAPASGAGVVTMGPAGGKTSPTRPTRTATSGKSLLELYIVNGMGHAWSGGKQRGLVHGPGTPRTRASILWQFFASHGR